jgi:hypothetical protein
MSEVEAAYLTAMWLESPSAFWLHPEGPLSDKSPGEWREEQCARVAGLYASRKERELTVVDRLAIERIELLLAPPDL